MKKIFATLIFAMVVLMAIPAMAIDNVRAHYGFWTYMQGSGPIMTGHSVSGVFPTGIDIKTVEKIKARIDTLDQKLGLDTLLRNYFELDIRVDLHTSNFSFPGLAGGGIEALVVQELNRINFDRWNVFMEFGGSYWTFVRDGDDLDVLGAYLGFGTRIKEAVDVNAGVHYLPFKDQDPLVIAGIALGRSF